MAILEGCANSHDKCKGHANWGIIPTCNWIASRDSGYLTAISVQLQSIGNCKASVTAIGLQLEVRLLLAIRLQLQPLGNYKQLATA